MYIVPQSAPAASAAAMPRPGWPPGAWVDDATASSVPPANITAAPPSTPRSRGQPAPRSSLKNTAPQTMPSRLFAFHNGNAMLSPMSLIAKIVRVLATAHRHPARIAQTTRWGAWRTSAPIADVPRSRAGRLQRARNTPTTIAREITTGERPRATILVGASAAPSQAPAAKPLTTPASCRRRRRAASSATGATSGSTRARPGRRRARQRGPTAAGPAAWRRGGYGRRASHWLQSEVARGELPGHDLAQGRGLGATARVLLGVRAAWVKRAAGRRVRGRRHVAGEHDALPLDPGIGHRHGGEERRRVGVARGGVQGCRGGPLDDLAEIHHREVMGDEEVSELPPLLQVGQQVQHLRLDGDVERAHRLVEHEELRLDRQGAGDTHPLALAARQLVRVALGEARVEAHLLEQRQDATFGLGPADETMDRERLGEGLPHGHAGIEGAVGVLKHDLHPPPQGAELAWRSASTSWPSSATRPASGSIRRRITRPTVDLPQPDSPTSPRVWPDPMANDTPSTARTAARGRPNPKNARGPGKCLTSPCTSTSGAAAAGVTGAAYGVAAPSGANNGRCGLRARPSRRRAAAAPPRGSGPRHTRSVGGTDTPRATRSRRVLVRGCCGAGRGPVPAAHRAAARRPATPPCRDAGGARTAPWSWPARPLARRTSRPRGPPA